MPQGALSGVEGEGWSSGRATQVSEIRGPAELLGIFPGQEAGSWKPSVPGKERGSGVLPRSFAGNKYWGGELDSPVQPGKTKTFCRGSCSGGCQKPNGRPLGSPGAVTELRGLFGALKARGADLESGTF